MPPAGTARNIVHPVLQAVKADKGGAGACLDAAAPAEWLQGRGRSADKGDEARLPGQGSPGEIARIEPLARSQEAPTEPGERSRRASSRRVHARGGEAEDGADADHAFADGEGEPPPATGVTGSDPAVGGGERPRRAPRERQAPKAEPAPVGQAPPSKPARAISQTLKDDDRTSGKTVAWGLALVIAAGVIALIAARYVIAATTTRRTASSSRCRRRGPPSPTLAVPTNTPATNTTAETPPPAVVPAAGRTQRW